MKSLLTILTEPALAERQVENAIAFARARNAHLDVIALGMEVAPFNDGQLGAAMSLVQAAFDRAQTEANALTTSAKALLAAAGPELSWAIEPQLVLNQGLAGVLGLRARTSDLVILPQPYGRGRGQDAEAVLDTVVFDARAPLLVLPSAPLSQPATAFERIVIAWNQSTEAMAAIRAALPLLQQAKTVSVAVIDPPGHGPEQSDPGGLLCRMLSRHGVHAEVAVLAKTLPRVSDVLTRHLGDMGADLLVMGAYGHSRLREALFGGATRDMLESCPLPMLIAH